MGSPVGSRTIEAQPCDRLATAFFDREPVADLDEHLTALRAEAAFVAEMSELLDVLDDRRRDAPHPWINDMEAPLAIHGRYRREKVLAGLEVVRKGKIPRVQAGVFYAEERGADLLFVTLQKTERGFSPKTMYRDHAVSPTIFHWESQHTAHAEGPPGHRLHPAHDPRVARPLAAFRARTSAGSGGGRRGCS